MLTTLLLITLLDGTTVNLQVPSNTKWEIETKYGTLSVPLQDMVGCEFGVHVEDEAKYVNAVKALGQNDFATRNAAMKLLRKDLRSAYKAILSAKNDKDAEIATRVEILLKECGRGFRIYDSIHTKEDSFSGVVKHKNIDGINDAIGAVSIPISKITSARVRMSKMSITISKLNVWVPATWVAGGRLDIKATGQLDLYPQGPGQYISTPDGHGTNTFGAYLPGALIGRIGQREFLIGSNFSVNGMEDGRLELMINRASWAGEPTGEYNVEIE